MITIRKIITLSILLILALSYRGYGIFQNQKFIDERNTLNLAFEEALESHISDLNEEGNSIVPPLEDALCMEVDEVEKNITSRYGGNVIGKIEIDKIGYSGIVLDETSEKNLNVAITKLKGNEINTIGNLVLVGHNMKDGSLFGKLELMEIEDTFNLIDIKGNLMSYKIFKKEIVSPYDLSPLKQTENEIKTTLITCTNEGKKRLVLYAIEYKN